MGIKKNYNKLTYATSDWSFENSYNDVRIKELVNG